MATTTTRLGLTKPASGDAISAFPAAQGPSQDTLDSNLILDKGAWSGATAYVIGDLVQSGTTSYVCLLGHTNQAPPNATYWHQLGGRVDTATAASTQITVAGTASAPTFDLGSSLSAKTFTGDITISTHNLITDAVTGSQIGTAPTQKLGFFGATPVVQVTGATDVLVSLVTLGLRAASANPPLNLGSGALTAGVSTLAATTVTTLGTAGNVTLSDANNVVLGTTTGTQIGTATTQKLGFYGTTPKVQAGAIIAPAATASTNITPFGYTTAAQADAIVSALRALLVATGATSGVGITA